MRETHVHLTTLVRHYEQICRVAGGDEVHSLFVQRAASILLAAEFRGYGTTGELLVLDRLVEAIEPTERA